MANKTMYLTTIDNPYSPATQFDEWYDYDTNQQGYYSCGYLERVVGDVSNLSDEEYNRKVEEGIAFILRTDPTGLYKAVFE